MKFTRKFILIALLLISYKAFSQNNKTIDEVCAVVGSNYILLSDIETQYLQILSSGKASNAKQTKCSILEDIIFHKLLLNQAEVDSVVITDEQVEQALNAKIRYFIEQFGSQERLESFYKKSIIEIKDEFKKPQHDQLMVEQVQQDIVSHIKVTPSEIINFYNSIPTDSVPTIESEFEIAQIVKKPAINTEILNETRAKLTNLRERIIKGEDFGSLAVLYSDDPGSAKKRGEVGLVDRNQLYPEYQAAAFDLKKGEVSEIVKTKAGYHIIQLIDRKGDMINTRHILLIPKISDQDIINATKQLDSIASLINNKEMTFEAAALKFSDDETKINNALMVNSNTGNSKFYAQEIDQKIFFSIEKLNVGEISKPLGLIDKEGNQSISIFYLVSRSKPHVANLKDDYNAIQNWVLNKKKNDEIEKWVREKISSSYIKINEHYKNCDFVKMWNLDDKFFVNHE